jgi:hypothetical protein
VIECGWVGGRMVGCGGGGGRTLKPADVAQGLPSMPWMAACAHAERRWRGGSGERVRELSVFVRRKLLKIIHGTMVE